MSPSLLYVFCTTTFVYTTVQTRTFYCRLDSFSYPSLMSSTGVCKYLNLCIIYTIYIVMLGNGSVFWPLSTLFCIKSKVSELFSSCHCFKLAWNRKTLVIYAVYQSIKWCQPFLLRLWLVSLYFRGLYGIIEQPQDFATFMLAIIVLNLFSYSLFYVAMKVNMYLYYSTIFTLQMGLV